MASTTEIQIVNIPNLEKIQSFLNDSAYKEVLENSENFNTRLCIERRLRMPFIDPQTGVAQNHCALFMKRQQRMPGFRDGQIYTYPSTRWRKPKRQYLLQHHNYRPYSYRETQVEATVPITDGTTVNPAVDTDSKDSHRNDEKEWYYDEMELSHHVDNFEEDPESDMDFDESYSSKRRRRKGAGVSKKTIVIPEVPIVKRGRRGRKKQVPSDGDGRRSRPGPPSLPPNTGSSPLNNIEEPQMPILTPEHKLPADETDVDRRKQGKSRLETVKAEPSPYCDFCLGDSRENKKTLLPEELVSCSDCGRSGHPSCLQFTPNMNISVKRYRWQCIECKYCSICGTSDNDDQLLFCDDCDRGYHMYCLSPPLTVPPEGSWSCKLCIEEFHSDKK